MSKHQTRGENCLQHYTELQYKWLAAPKIFFHYLKKESPPKFDLTEGSRVEQIAKTLNISERTVNFHIQNASRNMGVNNKHRASYKYFKP